MLEVIGLIVLCISIFFGGFYFGWWNGWNDCTDYMRGNNEQNK